MIDGVLTTYLLGFVTPNVDWERLEPLRDDRRPHFLSFDCSGAAYMQSNDGTRAPARQAIVYRYGFENWLYVAQAVAPVSLTFNSQGAPGGCAVVSGTIVGVPLNAPVNLSTRFPEPYTVQ